MREVLVIQNEITDDTITRLPDLMQPDTVKLCLLHTQLSAKSAEFIAKTIEQRPQITQLDLTGNQFNEPGLRALTACFSQLTSLNLDKNGIDDAILATLAESYPGDNSLLQLSLRHNQLSLKSKAALALLFSKCRALNSLDLMHNKISRAARRECSPCCKLILRLLFSRQSIKDSGQTWPNGLIKFVRAINSSRQRIILKEQNISTSLSL